MSQTTSLIRQIRQLSPEQQNNYLQSLTPTEQTYLLKNPLLRLDEKQLAPEGDWRYFWFRGARGTGKTEAGIAWTIDRLLTGDIEVAIIGPTHTDLIKEIIPRLLAELYKVYSHQDIEVNLSYGIIKVQKWKVIKLYSSENEIRGLNANAIYLEEVAKFCQLQQDKIELCINVADMGLRRKGVNPCQMFIASTPKPYSYFIKFDKYCKSHTKLYQQRILTIDDAHYIDFATRQAIKSNNNNRLGRQELYSDLLTDTVGAYWSRELLDRCLQPIPTAFLPAPHTNLPLTNEQLMGRAPKPVPPPANTPYLVRTGIGFDPAVSKGNDECGIITASLYSNNTAYVQYDDSGQYNPDEWSKLINSKYKDYGAAFVCVEKNNGGNTFDYILRSVNPHMKVIEIHNKQGKLTRAEHVSALYYQNKVFHTQTFPQLEDQMCTFSVNYQGSPDRLDSLGLVLTELFFPSAPASNYQIKNLPAWNR